MSKSVKDETEATMRRVQGMQGVIGYIVSDSEGMPITSTVENTFLYLSGFTSLIERARSFVRDVDPTDDLQFFRIRTKRNEIMIAPEKEFCLIVIQSCGEETLLNP